VVDKAVKTVGKKLCTALVGIKMGRRRANTVKKDQERKKGFRVDRCLDLHGPLENLAGDSCEGGFNERFP
jgi:hypothetical protein